VFDVTTDTLEPVYIIVSSEPLLVERAVRAVLEASVPENLRGFNYDVIDARGATASRILSAAQTLPMMGQYRMVLVRDIASIQAAELNQLTAYLADPSPSTVLVGLAAKVDKRVKFFAAAKKKKFMRELSAPRRLSPWIRDEAKQRGVNITPAAISRLDEVIGSDLARLSLSLEQLSLYAGDRAIEADDVDDLIAETRERTVFELTDAIGAANRQRALEAVHALFDQRQSAIGVIVMLARHMRQLGLVHKANAEKVPRGEVAKMVGAPPFVVDKLRDQSHHYSPPSVARALRLLGQADRALKGQAQMMRTLGRHLGERVVLDRLVGQILDMARP
jgi:DNA polymerase-3 subunit delta